MLTVCVTLAAGILFSDSATADKPLAFEVASVKPAMDSAVITRGSEKSGLAIVTSGSPSKETIGRLEYRSITLHALLQRAFGLNDYQIVGPVWLQSARYEVLAKYPEGSSQEQLSEMLRTMLIERFGLRTHHEQRRRPVYALIAEKGVNKIRLAQGGTASLHVSMGDWVRRIAGQLDTKTLVSILKTSVDRPIDDRTRIDGMFNATLEWAHSPDATGADGIPLPSLFTVLHEQLGLRLVPDKAMIDTLIVDYAERRPVQ